MNDLQLIPHIIEVKKYISCTHTHIQGSRVVGLGVTELAQFVYSVCTVLMVSFGGP